jgi:hypothetical protein
LRKRYPSKWTKEKGLKRSPSGVADAERTELVFVVDVSSFSKNGFVGTSEYEGARVDADFDEEGKGVFLTAEMAGRLRVRKGSKVTLTVEGETSAVSELTVAGVGKELRFSDPKVYYGIGREGGAVLRLTKG